VVQAPEPETPTGNALLHRLFGAEIITVADRTLREIGMREAADRLRAAGHHPMILPIGASTPLGSLGYALAALELVEQLDALSDGCSETRLFVPSSSCGTLAGLVLGIALLERTDIHLVGVSADADEPTILETTRALAREGAALLGAPTLDVEAVPLSADASQVGAGYAMPTDASTEALHLFASKEGLVLDPTYTAKAAAGLIAAVRAGPPTPSERIVFLHTGGAPGLLG
jgi:D-cysteine desulfhydrase